MYLRNLGPTEMINQKKLTDEEYARFWHKRANWGMLETFRNQSGLAHALVQKVGYALPGSGQLLTGKTGSMMRENSVWTLMLLRLDSLVVLSRVLHKDQQLLAYSLGDKDLLRYINSPSILQFIVKMWIHFYVWQLCFSSLFLCVCCARCFPYIPSLRHNTLECFSQSSLRLPTWRIGSLLWTRMRWHT